MQLFSRLFGKSPEKAIVNPLTVDMHSHLLPGIDDGVDDFEESISIIRGLMEMGYRKCITTPHVMSDFYRNEAHEIQALCRELNQKLKDAGIDFEVRAAAEYYMDEYFEKLLKEKNLLTLSSNYVLVETSYLNPISNLSQIVFNMQMAGYQPVLAHPERYVYMHDDFEKYKELRNRGFLFQVNLSSLVGYYSRESKKIAERLIKEKMVQFIGTDIHHLRHLKPLQDAMKTPAFAEAAELSLLNNSL